MRKSLSHMQEKVISYLLRTAYFFMSSLRTTYVAVLAVRTAYLKQQQQQQQEQQQLL